MTQDEQPAASPGVLLRLATIALAVVAIGLPIDTLASFAGFAAVVLIALTGSITARLARWLAAAALALAVLIVQLALPAPRIEEGHNAFLIGTPGGALERGLPREAFRIMAEQFRAAYPAHALCREGTFGCWGFNGLKDDTFALAADGMLQRPAYSRRVADIDFDNPIWLRLGFVNDLAVNIMGQPGGLERLHRDRRSLAVFGRWRLMLPWFVMYRFPADFIGSRLCWRGEVLWEGADETFERFDNDDFACRILQPADVGRRIFGVSIGPDAELAMSLESTFHVNARRILEQAVSVAGVIGILWLLVARWRPRRAAFPLLCGALSLLVVMLLDVTMIGGYRPFDGGDDGLVFSGFARVMLHALAHGDLMGVLRGAEDVYAFTAGMRYFRFAEFLAFGDSVLGYLLLLLLLPLLVYRLCARFLGTDWALAITLLFMTPVGILFGTSHWNFVEWAARGYADPLGAMALLAGLVLLAGRAGPSFDGRAPPAFFGALLMACAIVLRPNLVLGAAVMLAGVAIAALWQRKIARLAALCIGFLPVFFPLWHNWHFGHVAVLFSDILTNDNIYKVPPVTYLNALGEIARLDLAGDNLVRIARQLLQFLSGPSGLIVMVPVHIAALAILIRVVCARRFEPMLRLTALGALALIPPAFVYVITTRYHLALWLLTALVAAAWLQREGLALFDARWPTARARLAQTSAVAWLGRALTRLKGSHELEDATPRA
jgi:hypothetical protein